MVTADLVWHCFSCEIVCCRLEKIVYLKLALKLSMQPRTARKRMVFKNNLCIKCFIRSGLQNNTNMYAEGTEKGFIEKKWNEKRKILPFYQDNILGGEFMTLSNISDGTFSVKKLMGKSSIIDLWKGNICTWEPWRTWIAYWCKPWESH